MSNPENFLARWSRRKHAKALEREQSTSSAAPASLEEAAAKEKVAGTQSSDHDRGISPSTARAAAPIRSIERAAHRIHHRDRTSGASRPECRRN